MRREGIEILEQKREYTQSVHSSNHGETVWWHGKSARSLMKMCGKKASSSARRIEAQVSRSSAMKFMYSSVVSSIRCVCSRT